MQVASSMQKEEYLLCFHGAFLLTTWAVRRLMHTVQTRHPYGHTFPPRPVVPVFCQCCTFKRWSSLSQNSREGCTVIFMMWQSLECSWTRMGEEAAMRTSSGAACLCPLVNTRPHAASTSHFDMRLISFILCHSLQRAIPLCHLLQLSGRHRGSGSRFSGVRRCLLRTLLIK